MSKFVFGFGESPQNLLDRLKDTINHDADALAFLRKEMRGRAVTNIPKDEFTEITERVIRFAIQNRNEVIL